MVESKNNQFMMEIPWNDGTNDKLYIKYSNSEKLDIQVSSDLYSGDEYRELKVTVETNSLKTEPEKQTRFSILVTQRPDGVKVIATFNDNKSSYSNSISQY